MCDLKISCLHKIGMSPRAGNPAEFQTMTPLSATTGRFMMVIRDQFVSVLR